MKWTDSHTTLKRLPISFPTGSEWHLRVLDAIWQWNEVPGHVFTFYDGVDNDSEWGYFDGNEVAFAYSGDIDGQLALTRSRVGFCCPLDYLWSGHNMPIRGDRYFL